MPVQVSTSTSNWLMNFVGTQISEQGTLGFIILILALILVFWFAAEFLNIIPKGE